ncbi:MAG: hypothetical protein ACLQJ0_13250 [Steroidobacteraceae bacterium]|jgi:hypothetical protein
MLAMLKSQSLVPFKVLLLFDLMRALRRNCLKFQHRGPHLGVGRLRRDRPLNALFDLSLA